MLTVIIRNNGEDNVVRLTYENLWHELKDIPGAELLVSESWFDYLPKIKNSYVCFVEADCLVSEKYFVKQLKEFRTNPGRKISMLTAKTAVSNWDNCFYGYRVNTGISQDIIPANKKSSSAYAIQVGYFPGAIVRLSMFKEAFKKLHLNDSWINDLVFLSAELSGAFWRQGADGVEKKVQNGNPVYINPGVTYVTTESYVNDVGKFDVDMFDLEAKFMKESI